MCEYVVHPGGVGDEPLGLDQIELVPAGQLWESDDRMFQDWRGFVVHAFGVVVVAPVKVTMSWREDSVEEVGLGDGWVLLLKCWVPQKSGRSFTLVHHLSRADPAVGSFLEFLDLAGQVLDHGHQGGKIESGWGGIAH